MKKKKFAALLLAAAMIGTGFGPAASFTGLTPVEAATVSDDGVITLENTDFEWNSSLTSVPKANYTKDADTGVYTIQAGGSNKLNDFVKLKVFTAHAPKSSTATSGSIIVSGTAINVTSLTVSRDKSQATVILSVTDGLTHNEDVVTGASITSSASVSFTPNEAGYTFVIGKTLTFVGDESSTTPTNSPSNSNSNKVVNGDKGGTSSAAPTAAPSTKPSTAPSTKPSTAPSASPSAAPTEAPVDTHTETTDNADGTKTETTENTYADGTKEVIKETTAEDGSKVTEKEVTNPETGYSLKETVKSDGKGNTETNSTEIKANGTKIVKEASTKADGSHESTALKTTKSGKETVELVSGNTNTGTETTLEAKANGNNLTWTKIETNEKKVTIPATVTVGGKTLKTTEIAKGALQGNKKITNVTLPKGIKKIGANAFKGDKNLKKIKINAKSLKSVGKNAFKGIAKNATITLQGTKKQVKAAKNKIIKSGAKNVKIKRA